MEWRHFLLLFCMFEQGRIEDKHLIRFWMKFFDPLHDNRVPEDVYMSLLEQIIRGKLVEKPTATTKLFAEMYQQRMREAGCLGPEKELMMDKYKEAFENGELDI